MDNDRKSGGCERYIVASVALTCLSNLLMTSWAKDHTRAELDELARAIERKIKNATIEGLSYDQQVALVRRSVEYVDKFLEVFHEKLRDKT